MLFRSGIGCSVHFIPTHHHPYFQDALGPEIRNAFPVADAVFDQVLSLPLYPGLRDDQVDRVCAEIADLRARHLPPLHGATAGGPVR